MISMMNGRGFPKLSGFRGLGAGTLNVNPSVLADQLGTVTGHPTVDGGAPVLLGLDSIEQKRAVGKFVVFVGIPATALIFLTQKGPLAWIAGLLGAALVWQNWNEVQLVFTRVKKVVKEELPGGMIPGPDGQPLLGPDGMPIVILQSPQVVR